MCVLLQEVRVQEVRREMGIDLCDTEAIERQMADVLDKFISDIGDDFIDVYTDTRYIHTKNMFLCITR